MRFDGLEQQVVGLACRRYGLCGVECLATGLIVRQHLQIDAGSIHGGKPRVAEIEQLGDDVEAQQLLPVVAAVRAGRQVLFFAR